MKRDCNLDLDILFSLSSASQLFFIMLVFQLCHNTDMLPTVAFQLLSISKFHLKCVFWDTFDAAALQ